MNRKPRFEVVHSDAGWFGRFVAANGQTVWVTESVRRRGTVLNAIRLLARVHRGEAPRVHEVDER